MSVATAALAQGRRRIGRQEILGVSYLILAGR